MVKMCVAADHRVRRIRASVGAVRLRGVAVALVALGVVSSVVSGAVAWERFDDLPRADAVRKAQSAAAGLHRVGRSEVRFAPDGRSVAWREGSEWLTLDLPPRGEPSVLEVAPEWPAWSAPSSPFPQVPPPPPAPGRGFQSLSATAPDGRRVALFRAGNVVITGGAGGDIQVTTEGSPGPRGVRFGNASWVYGEELDQTTAMWWSPDGRFLAYYRFDDREVVEVPMLTGVETVRPSVVMLPFPKAGESNPIAQLEVFDTEQNRRIPIEVGDDREQYIHDIVWTPDSRFLLFNRMGRHQNRLEVMVADPRTGESRPLIVETQETWQHHRPERTFLSDGRRFLWVSERSGHRQFELWDVDAGLVRTLTDGDFPVQAIVRLDEAAGVLWYTAMASETRLNPQLMQVSLDGSAPRRLTPGDRHYGSFTIAPDGRWFTAVEQFVDLAPEFVLFSAEAPEVAPRVLREREENPWGARGLRAPEFFTCLAADGETVLYGVLHKPSNFDPSKKYPLLMDVYAGPGVQTVNSRAATPDPRSEFGMLIAKVDNRGTPGRGKAFEGATYLRLGGPDIDDQAAAARCLAERPYVDGSRIAITGHSYGGYATIMALLRYPEVFSVGVAGAAVTDWRQYDTIYTERYMRTPKENAEGYDAGSAVRLAPRLRGRLMLIHGMVDDNVHVTNLFEFAHALQRANRPFDMMIFPTADHGVRGPAVEGVKWSYLLKHLGLMAQDGDAKASLEAPSQGAEEDRSLEVIEP
ncbi:MAG: DPP IV N-terminal domain-containing protein [Phycisphaeraceae bacterium]|nr:DPP IV N-terminal domain-containing protein [Phycisphaeraceae bacterium]